MIKAGLDAVLGRIRLVCERVGRDPDSVTVVGVTKYSDISAINEALSAGLRHIAENRVQSAREKFPLIMAGGASSAVVRHLIGHLQSNKARDAVELFDLIQTVDSMKLAAEIDKRALAAGKVQDILVQVDIALEEQKFGLPENELDDFLVYLGTCANIRVRGLMAMAPLTEDRALIRGVFHCLRAHYDRLNAARASKFDCLSMGMSADYEIAVEEGATMVRIGSLIFK